MLVSILLFQHYSHKIYVLLFSILCCHNRFRPIAKAYRYTINLVICDCHAKTMHQNLNSCFGATINSYVLAQHVSHGQTQLVCFSGPGVDLQPCKTMADTLAPVEHANWM